MGFWKNLRAVLRSPDIVAELEGERAARQQLYAALSDANNELEKMDTDVFLLERKLERTATQLDACQAAIRTLCSQPPSTEELKRIYDAIAPAQDEFGFSLYFAAKDLTGIDVPSQFPYEDNRGLFEDAKGPLLLRYLVAAQFGAVTWEIVPGTCHEKAILGTVDTSAPEYRAFEGKLYEKALEWMGFQDIIAPGQELKLYSRLSGELTAPGYDGPQPLDGNDLAKFRTVILQGIEDGRMPEEEERGLMLYYDGPSDVDEKVVSLFPTVEEADGELYGVAVCRINGTLSAGELAELKEYCRCQYNDAWGEEFAQRPRRTRFGDLHVSFYVDSSDSILTKDEMAAGLPGRAPHRLTRGGDAR